MKKLKEKTKLWILLFIFNLTIGSLFAQVISTPPGDGTVDNPFLISTVGHLAWLSGNTGNNAYATPQWWDSTENGTKLVYFRQTAHIDASATRNWNNGGGMRPIGGPERSINGVSGRHFIGVYDGQNHTISNLYMNTGTYDVAGFFAFLTGLSPTVRAGVYNLGLVECDIWTYGARERIAGGIAGRARRADIFGCYTTGKIVADGRGSISQTSTAGGIVGKAGHGVNISYCKSAADVRAYATTYYSLSPVDNRYAEVGGITGTMEGTSTEITSINNSYYTTGINWRREGSLYAKTNRGAWFSKDAAFVGGIAGRMYDHTAIKKTLAAVNAHLEQYELRENFTGSTIYISDYFVGGIAGHRNSIYNCTIENSVACVILYYRTGFQNWNGFTDLVHNEETGYNLTNNENIKSYSPELNNISLYTARGWDFNSIWDSANNLNGGMPYLRLPAHLPATPGLEYTLINNGKEYAVGQGSALGLHIIIPPEHNLLPVTTIANAGFQNSYMWSISLPSSITTIGDYAFNNCSYLGDIILGDRVTTIGEYAFNNSGLHTITIPRSVRTIGASAFNNCSSLSDITIENGVTTIGQSAFRNCTSLTEIIIPPSVVNMEEQIFWDCSNLTIHCMIAAQPAGWSSGWNFQNRPVVWGYTPVPNLAYTLIDNGRAYAVDRGTSSATEIVLPAVYNGLPITMIADAGFRNSNITKVTIPSTVTRIGVEAFRGCNQLRTITLPNSVTDIDDRAFYNCLQLTDIILPNSVTNIGDGAFSGCRDLVNITIPSRVRSISDNMFSGCVSLREFTILNGTTAIGEKAFENCTGLLYITIPNTVQSIGENAFDGCTNLASVNFETPSRLESIGENAFKGNTSLTSIIIPNGVMTVAGFNDCTGLVDVFLPDTVTHLYHNAFTGCENLYSITMPKDLVEIGVSTFEGCTSLTSIELPGGLEIIGPFAFAGCTNLTSVIIPESVIDIGNSAFAGSTNLVIYTAIEQANVPLTWMQDWNIDNATVVWGYSYTANLGYTLINGGTEYAVSSGTATATDIVIPASYNGKPITAIADNGFLNGTMTSVYIPNGVTSIGENAFRGCEELTSISIPPSVSSIGDFAFAYTPAVASIEVQSGNAVYKSEGNCIIRIADDTLIAGCKNSIIPNTVTNIGTSAFAGCSNLTVLNVPNGVLSIGDYAFADCTGLETILIRDTIVSIGEGAYMGCSGANIVFDNYNTTSALRTIGDNAFRGCSRFVGMVNGHFIAPMHLESIGANAFSRCDGINRIVITSNVNSIGDGAFSYNPNITAIEVFSNSSFHSEGNCLIRTADNTLIVGSANSVIPANVTAIGDRAFAGNVALNRITIPAGVESIGDATFEYCIGLKTVNITNSITSIGENAFNGCVALPLIIIPNTVTDIGNDAFMGCYALTIVAEATETPAGWEEYWNPNDRPVIWGYVAGTTGLAYTLIDNGTAYSVGRGSITSGDVVIPAIYNGLPVTTIINSAFSVSTGNQITSIQIPNTITTIGNAAFYGCNRLGTITIPASVTSIGERPFASANLLSINVEEGNSFYSGAGNNLIRIADNTLIAGSGNSIIPDGVETIAYGAFSQCHNLTKINIPASVKTIERDAFWNCNGLLEIILPHTVTTIGNEAIYIGSQAIIYAMPESQPAGWDETFNRGRTVVWGAFPPPAEVSATANNTTILLQWKQDYAGKITNEYDLSALTVLWGTDDDIDTAVAFTGEPDYDETTETYSITFADLTAEATYYFFMSNIYDSSTGNPKTITTPFVKTTAETTTPDEYTVVDMVYVTGLHGNYPNPFNPSTTIQFTVGTQYIVSSLSQNPTPNTKHPITIDIYNIKGQKVRSLVNDTFEAGHHTVQWNGTNDSGHNVGSGIYFYRMRAGDYTETKRMLLLK